MAEIAFIRLAEVINRKQDMRVVSVTVKPTIADCSGTIYFTDLMLQEGPALTGYTPHTEPFLKKLRVDGEVKAPVWFNGVVRGEETVILFNLGETSAGLDVHLYPKSDLEAGGSFPLPGRGRPEGILPQRRPRRSGPCSACQHTAVYEERQPGEKRGLLSVQRRLGFQA